MEKRPEHDETVREGYDQVAERYLAERDQWESTPHLERLVDLLEPNARILDVGCGGGVPVDRYLVDKGHRVIGVDISPKQIDLARQNVPGAEFEVRDMQDLEEGGFEVDAVVSFYAIFHTPRQSHGRTLKTLASFLPQGGLLLVTMGAGEWEGEEDFHGTPMWWSHYGPGKNRQLVELAGFEVLFDEIDDSGGEQHQVLFARKGISDEENGSGSGNALCSLKPSDLLSEITHFLRDTRHRVGPSPSRRWVVGLGAPRLFIPLRQIMDSGRRRLWIMISAKCGLLSPQIMDSLVAEPQVSVGSDSGSS